MQSEKIVLKAVILGDRSVGKTSLMYQYVKKLFSGYYNSTIGTDFLIKHLTIDNKQVVLQVSTYTNILKLLQYLYLVYKT